MAGKLDAHFNLNLIPPSALKPKESLEDALDRPNLVHRDAFENSIAAGLAATTRGEASQHYDDALDAQRQISDRYAKNATNKQMLEDLVKLKKHVLSLEDTAPKHEDLDRWYAENKNDFLLDAYQDKPAKDLGTMQAGGKANPTKIAKRKKPEKPVQVTVTVREDQHPLTQLVNETNQAIAALRTQPGSAAGYVRNINELGEMINKLNHEIHQNAGTPNENYLTTARERLYGAVSGQMRGLYQRHSLAEITQALKEVGRDSLVGDSEYYRHPTVEELNPSRKPTSV